MCVCKLKNTNDHNGSVVISITISGLGSPRGPGRPKGDLQNTHIGVLSLGSSVMKIDGFILRVNEGEDYAFGKSFSSQILECHLKYQMGVKIFVVVKL